MVNIINKNKTLKATNYFIVQIYVVIDFGYDITTLFTMKGAYLGDCTFSRNFSTPTSVRKVFVSTVY